MSFWPSPPVPLWALIIIATGATLFVVNHYWVEHRNKRRLEAAYRQLQHVLRGNHLDHAYSPLPDPESKTIRLIELLPSENDEAIIRISLLTVSLLNPERQRYEAISYCWGDPIYALPVFLSDNSLLWVTKSLHGALKRLRLSDQPRLLWADAVCINQLDVDEKNRQVCIMGDIYRNAEQVIIWLGEEADESEVVGEFIPRLLHAKELYDAHGESRSYMQLGHAEMNAYEIPPRITYSPDHYDALEQVIKRPWFQRVWIIQEVALSKNALVICGDWCIPWESFQQAWYFISTQLQPLSIDYGRPTRCLDALSLTRATVSSNSRVSLRHLLAWHSLAEASDPRDKVFGLVGLAQDPGGVQIDYTKSVEKVFRDTALVVMVKSRSLDMLSLAASRRERLNESRLPSWTPDWRSTDLSLPLAFAEGVLFGQIRALKLEYSATRHSTYIPAASHVGECICISGYELDTIVLMGPSTSPLHSIQSIWNVFDDDRVLAVWSRICDASSNQVYELTGESMRDAFQRTLMIGLSFDSPIFKRMTKENRKSFESRIKIIGVLGGSVMLNECRLFKMISVILFSFILIPSVLLRGLRNHNDNTRWGATVELLTCGRRIIKTKRGFIGLVNGDASVGDSIVLLEGGKVPYVVRWTAEDNAYVLTGDAYVHGHMTGREWDPDRCRPMWLA